MLTLILTRHGLTPAGNVLLGGQLDVPLAPQGRAQAESLRNRLAGVRIDRIVASPMLRALETAQVVAAGRPIEVDERLRELDYGRWEGLSHAEADARDPELRARWEADPATTHSPGGECGDDVAARALRFLVDLVAAELGGPDGPSLHQQAHRRSPDPGGSRPVPSEAQAEAEGERRVLAVAHGTYNRILMCVALGVPIGDYRRRFVQDWTNLTVLRYEPGDGPKDAQLILANDVSHQRAHGEAPWG
jgi:broad specificity phosphatase PhoE